MKKINPFGMPRVSNYYANVPFYGFSGGEGYLRDGDKVVHRWVLDDYPSAHNWEGKSYYVLPEGPRKDKYESWEQV